MEHKDQPPGYSALLMRSYDEELNSILDFAGLPSGRGSGYGVGVADDELPALDLRCVCVHACVCVYLHIECMTVMACVCVCVCVCVYVCVYVCSFCGFSAFG